MTDDARSQQADALISTLAREDSGRLTVFLGAAPGVGKTYTMLERARERIRAGDDVLAGIVETHGRPETAALLRGIVQLPCRRLIYKDHHFEELDLDGVLERKPRIVLVDELAHRNAPGSRHERRWQDVIEILDAGIDVYTTINIQHVESLNDIVFGITGVKVSETVPDALFDRLRDIVLVDLPPRELIERLRLGKVYLPDQAAQALQQFFTPSNLSALRELAIQTAADLVDSDLREVQTAKRRPHHLALRRRVMVAIDGLGSADYLVRLTRRISERRNTKWIVVAVQSQAVVDSQWQMDIDRAFALAQRLGGETVLLHSNRPIDALLDFAGHHQVSTLVLGRSRHSWLAHLLQRTAIQQILKQQTPYELVIVGSTGRAHEHVRRQRTADSTIQRAEWMTGCLASIAALSIAWLIQRWVSMADLSLIFMLAVVFVATRTRMTIAIMTAFLNFLVYNYFFLEPRFTLMISAPHSLVTISLFLITALIAGRLASRLHGQVIALRAANTHGKAMQDLGRRLSAAADLQQVLSAGRQALSHALDGDAWLRVQHLQTDPGDQLNALDLSAVNWTQHHGQPSGRYTDTLAGAKWWCLPMAGEKNTSGVVALRFHQNPARLTVEQRRLAEAMVEDIGQAVIRTLLVADLEQARMTNETERLRSALLSSVSHDLRSPLAAMIGSASSLAQFWQTMSTVDRTSLLEAILQEGQRLDRYIQNLLDMTRLGHRGLTLHREWIGIDELIGSAVRRLQRYQTNVRIEIALSPDIPPIWVHPALIEQAVFNVLENAASFSPPGEAIRVMAQHQAQTLLIDIADRGPGIPEEERTRIFDMFYSFERGDRGRQGSGLGLTICRGMVNAHGGNVQAFSRPDGQGTLIRITLPYLRPVPTDRHDP